MGRLWPRREPGGRPETHFPKPRRPCLYTPACSTPGFGQWVEPDRRAISRHRNGRDQMTTMTRAEGAVTGGVRVMVRIEGAAVFLGATAAYFYLGGAWWVYLVLLFSPDLSFLGYGLGPRSGRRSIMARTVFALGRAWRAGRSIRLGLLGAARTDPCGPYRARSEPRLRAQIMPAASARRIWADRPPRKSR